jgi:type VI secretion system protein ImpF
MPRPTDDFGLQLSIIDRLTDLDPGSAKDPRHSGWETAREFKASLCRDLAAILNTRRADEDFDPAFVQCTNSILTYGVADFTSYNLNNGFDRERVRQSVERAIRQFEPRLTHVTVTVEQPDSIRPLLKFQIEAILRTDSAASEPVVFDATIHRDSRRVSVSGADS